MTQLELQPGRALLVRLEPGLDHSRLVGIFHAIKYCPGVDAVVDLSIVSEETLALFLLPDEQKVKR